MLLQICIHLEQGYKNQVLYSFERCFDSGPMAVKSMVRPVAVAEAIPFFIASLKSNWSWD